MYTTNEFRKGLKVEIDGEPFVMVEAQFVKPGKGQAFSRVKMKSMTSGLVLERTYKSGEKLDSAALEERRMQFLYKSGDEYHLMDNTNYEEIVIGKDKLGDGWKYVTENMEVVVLMHNRNPINIELPNFVVLKITHADPGFKGDTATGGTKSATLETGATIQVPLFVCEGDYIKIDTRSDSYVERAKK